MSLQSQVLSHPAVVLLGARHDKGLDVGTLYHCGCQGSFLSNFLAWVSVSSKQLVHIYSIEPQLGQKNADGVTILFFFFFGGYYRKCTFCYTG